MTPAAPSLGGHPPTGRGLTRKDAHHEQHLSPARPAAPRPRRGTAQPTQRPPATPAADRGHDTVEFSSAAQLLSGSTGPDNVRQDLIDQVRAEIAAGIYETPDKIDAAVDNLGKALFDA